MASIHFKNVTKVFDGKTTVIENLNLEITDKEFVILVGPSGCGKSTTLRMIAGLEDITAGELYIGDKLVNGMSPKDRDIAMVFQSYALYPHMTVYKNMAFGLKLRKVPKDEIDRKVRRAAEILDIEQYLNRKPRALSGGQRQRVALGRAMVREPKVFLLDEPLSNLDAKLRAEMRNQITELHRQLKTTFVYVTHDQVEAMTMADRIVVMKDGVIQQSDTPQHLYNHPQNTFVAGFIGTPRMNFINADVSLKGQQLFVHFGEFELAVPQRMAESLRIYDKRKVILGIRSEDLQSGVKNGAKIKLKVDSFELMGNEINVYSQIGASHIIAKAPPSMEIKENEIMDFFINTERLHIFDIETERLICD
ncbi:MAG: sn-glycerol-3-phosphate ABC transporter ATP-binding protein UgpC [Clostridiales bacterium]|nr:sn-glycerol-3-phosphate ABC transporter ATP-binding protein UgpC [Clostridiales bacterium]